MKKFLSLIFAMTLAISLFSSCQRSGGEPTPPSVTTQSYEAQIKALEDRIAALQNDRLSSDLENQKQIESLKAQIEELKKSGSSNTSQTTQSTATTSPKAILIYSIEEGKAIITGFTGDDDNLLIPSSIDGFEVYAIASNAFEGYSFRSVIISDGVQVIDWFSFYNCKDLQSITIPSSVRKIGYSAFDGCAKQFTIYCESGSFAESYARSYGITYAIM